MRQSERVAVKVPTHREEDTGCRWLVYMWSYVQKARTGEEICVQEPVPIEGICIKVLCTLGSLLLSQH